MMPRNRTKLLLGVLGVMLLAAVPATAQDLRGMQLFAQAEVTPYGHLNGLPPKEGYFFVWDHLTWNFAKPEVVEIGNPDLDGRIVYNVGDEDNGWTQTNTHDTSFFSTDRKQGDRIEFGRMFKRHGWMFGAYALKSSTQLTNLTHVGMVFEDDPAWRSPVDPGDSGGRLIGAVIDQGELRPLPVTFDQVEIRNSLRHWSCELMGILRSRQKHHGGYFEYFAGVRYMIMDDTFSFNGTYESTEDAAADSARVILADTVIHTEVNNHLIGPQIGARWFRKRGRWMISTEGRFFAAMNQVAMRQGGELASRLQSSTRTAGQPELMYATNYDHSVFVTEFSPVAEARVGARYQLSRSVSFRAGWTGIWMDNIHRSSSSINYALEQDSVMGIIANNEQQTWINGWQIGIDVNR